MSDSPQTGQIRDFFSYHIQYILAPEPKCTLSDLTKNPGFGANLTHFGSESGNSDWHYYAVGEIGTRVASLNTV